jgi:hypothetical protein
MWTPTHIVDIVLEVTMFYAFSKSLRSVAHGRIWFSVLMDMHTWHAVTQKPGSQIFLNLKLVFEK